MQYLPMRSAPSFAAPTARNLETNVQGKGANKENHQSTGVDNTKVFHAEASRTAEGNVPRTQQDPWLQAASRFTMNSDFEIPTSCAQNSKTLSFQELLAVMKAESKGKKTIQALGDKILLHGMLDNLSIPQMPLLFATHCTVNKVDVDKFVQTLETSTEEDAFDFVVKPTHLSNSAGTILFSRDVWRQGGWNSAKLVAHMEHCLAQKAESSESEALRSLVPGIVIQKRYRSDVDFHTPLELRVVTLWGKARVGVWWWGREGPPAQRTSWLVRRPAVEGELGSQDDWKVLHHHSGFNPGFSIALDIFKSAMPAMAVAAEAIAEASGAPFLRSDFFVGSKKWGVRLNEVAYGSGCDMVYQPTDSAMLLDDSPVVAEILQRGFTRTSCKAPDHFLVALGAHGVAYEPVQDLPGLHVEALENGASPLLAEAMHELSKDACIVQVARENCRTMVFAPPLPPGTRDESQKPSTGRTLSVQAAVPQEFPCVAPADCEPGQLALVQGPLGPVRVKIPPGVSPGERFMVSFASPFKQNVKIAKGAKAGDKVSFRGPRGEQLETCVPRVMLPGEILAVGLRAVMVAVPPDARPGDNLAFAIPNYERREVCIPEDAKPDQYLWVQY